jgi:hypothetical protein
MRDIKTLENKLILKQIELYEKYRDYSNKLNEIHLSIFEESYDTPLFKFRTKLRKQQRLSHPEISISKEYLEKRQELMHDAHIQFFAVTECSMSLKTIRGALIKIKNEIVDLTNTIQIVTGKRPKFLIGENHLTYVDEKSIIETKSK